MKIKSIVKIFRHGARTSSSVGRIEDNILSPNRMGLTCVGYSQFFKIGLDIINKKEKYFDQEFNDDFNSFLNKGKMNIILSKKSRVLESAQALADGILSANSEDHKSFQFKEEKKFAENVYDCEKYDPNSTKYENLLRKFQYFHNKQKIIYNNPQDKSKISFEINHKIFDKTLDQTEENQKMIKEKFVKHYNTFQAEKEDYYVRKLKPYLEKLMLHDLSGKIFDFNENQVISKEYFDKTDFSLLNIKKLMDFIRCNKFYEDIPIYKQEYSEFIKDVKEFLVNHYNYSSTYEDDVCFLRLDNFFHKLIKIIDHDKSSYNVFINHNSAIRSLIKFFLSKESYDKISQTAPEYDEDFFLICPKFAAEYKMIILEDKKILFFLGDRNITKYFKKEFLVKEKEEDFVDYFKLKNYLNTYHNLEL